MPLTGSAPVTVLEGDYSTWTNKWTNDLCPSRISLFSLSESADTILLYEGYYGILHVIKLTDGTYVDDPLDYPIYAYEQNIFNSVLNKYAILVKTSAGHNILDIYKNNLVVQSIDLTDAFGYTHATQLAMSPNGKYIYVTDSIGGSALFKGS